MRGYAIETRDPSPLFGNRPPKSTIATVPRIIDGVLARLAMTRDPMEVGTGAVPKEEGRQDAALP